MPYLIAPERLGDLLGDAPAYRADQVRAWLYESPVIDASEMTNLPLELRDRLGERLWPFDVEAEQSAERGRTHKWLFRCRDGASVESVLMAYPNRTTLCISSQAGCAMACSFCATGQFGFERHLEAGEIVAQVAYAKAWLRRTPIPQSPDRIGNVVFMGMGEPLANYDRVRESIRRLVEVMGMSARSITVSTVGVAPAIRRLAAEPWPVRLALSLHAADDELRNSLVPLNTRYPIDDLVAAADEFRRSKGRRISLEWTLIDGVNDTAEQARALASIAAELRAHVDVIPLNPTPLSEDRPPRDAAVRAFAAAARRAGANVTVRDTRGRAIDAACGQLRAGRATQGTEPASR
jgi:23S rRNA (adenine2503-C2)-methyltransferase